MSNTTSISGWEALLPRLTSALAPKYEVQHLLGYGGMAGVYLADEVRLGRKVAIKVISPGLVMDSSFVARFEQEARATARLRHPNIITIYEVDHKDDFLFIAMSYCSGRTLGQVMGEDVEPLDVDVTVAWLHEVASALDHAHHRGIVHRDIKPGNILLDEEGRALVTDFGIAKVADQPGLTSTGFLVGTPSYMSPEQCKGVEVGSASDQYSLGIVAYQMITGKTPFTGPTMAVIQAHLNQDPPPIRGLRPDCPEEVATAVERMLAKEADDRWPTLGEAIRAAGGRAVYRGDDVHRTMTRLSRRISAIQVDPPTLELEPSQQFSFDAVALDADDTPLPGRALTWTSSAPDVVTVQPDGTVLAKAPGKATLAIRGGSAMQAIEVQVAQAEIPPAPGPQAGVPPAEVPPAEVATPEPPPVAEEPSTPARVARPAAESNTDATMVVDTQMLEMMGLTGQSGVATPPPAPPPAQDPAAPTGTPEADEAARLADMMDLVTSADEPEGSLTALFGADPEPTGGSTVEDGSTADESRIGLEASPASEPPRSAAPTEAPQAPQTPTSQAPQGPVTPPPSPAPSTPASSGDLPDDSVQSGSASDTSDGPGVIQPPRRAARSAAAVGGSSAGSKAARGITVGKAPARTSGGSSPAKWALPVGGVAVFAAAAFFMLRGPGTVPESPPIASGPTAESTRPDPVPGTPVDVTDPDAAADPDAPTDEATDPAESVVDDPNSTPQETTPTSTPAQSQPQPTPERTPPARPTTGQILLGGSTPAGAVITAVGPDGRTRSISGTTQLPAGQYRMTAMAEGYRTEQATVDVPAGGSRTWAPAWERAAADPVDPPPAQTADPTALSAQDRTQIRSAIDGFVGALRQRDVATVLRYVPSSVHGAYTQMLELDYSRWEITVRDVGEPQFDGTTATVPLATTMNSVTRGFPNTGPLNFTARLIRAGSGWSLQSMTPSG